MAVERKAEDESNFFWLVKMQQLNTHQGRPREETAAQLARDEKELFDKARESHVLLSSPRLLRCLRYRVCFNIDLPCD